MMSIPKDVFNKNRLQYGDVICIDKMEQRNKYRKIDGFEKPVKVDDEFEWWVISYSMVTDFSGFKRKTYDS